MHAPQCIAGRRRSACKRLIWLTHASVETGKKNLIAKRHIFAKANALDNRPRNYAQSDLKHVRTIFTSYKWREKQRANFDSDSPALDLDIKRMS